MNVPFGTLTGYLGASQRRENGVTDRAIIYFTTHANGDQGARLWAYRVPLAGGGWVLYQLTPSGTGGDVLALVPREEAAPL